MGRRAPPLVREFLRRSLYEDGQGYFSKTDCVFSPPSPVAFRSLTGQYAYIKELDKLYSARAQSWLTPVEIFRPWYSRALARYVVESLERRAKAGGADQDLVIYEVGGGNGTNARHLLDYLKELKPALYARTQYTLIEISDTMAARQENLVGPAHPGRIKVLNQDFCRLGEEHADDRDCFVIALEVFDNLPHDKLVRVQERRDEMGKTTAAPWWVFRESDRHEWFETHVAPAAQGGQHGQWEETLSPLQDETAVRCAKLFLRNERSLAPAPVQGDDVSLRGKISNWARNSLRSGRDESEQGGGAEKSVFVPSGLLQFLDVLRTRFPAHHLLAADFDQLPPPDVSHWTAWRNRGEAGHLFGCRNAPLVASKNHRAETVDHTTYLVPVGSADIFFQTDFETLQEVYREQTGHAAESVQSKDFLLQYADHPYTQTRSGFNPMLEDYHNTRFFVTQSKG